ncbi:MAG: DUF1674 domain-containing protein [Gammaproteobacteria bacterium]|nr:DUF1674 domain-containing protein [Gammaproteobacteria bacterium]MCP5407075.1 DUF1674 domain-containing protein [Chromatiaceae bacterium]MCP5408814.1 DUF1674 domain-containing protein [Chromatiaceae bacterium]MCP5445079.1 DUF1674 domain-containing protein [Chromatiaceae bacterium]
MQEQRKLNTPDPELVDTSVSGELTKERSEKVKEYGGPKGKEPTRYGDWEKNGRCIDF